MPKKKVKTNIAKKSGGNLMQDRVLGIALFTVVAIMPLVVRLAFARVPPELTALYGIEIYPCFFAYYKGWVLGISATVIALYCLFDLLVGGYAKMDFKAILKSPPVIASGVFLLMALISALLSQYQFTSWRGTADRGEGMLILTAYFIVFFTAMFHVRESKHAKLIMYGLTFSSIIMGAIGLGQFLGRDFYTTSFADRLIVSARLRLAIGEAAFEPRFRIANGTLYNPNTFGKYTAMAAPILLACALTYDGRKWMRVVFFAGGGLMLAGVLGSRSLGGFIGISVAAAVLAVTFICRFFYQIKQRRMEQDTAPGISTSKRVLGGILGTAVIVAMFIGLYFVPPVNERVALILDRFQTAIRAEAAPSYNFVVDGDRLTVYWGEYERFTMVMDEFVVFGGRFGPLLAGDPWRIYDAAGQPVPLASRTETPATEDMPLSATYIYNVPGYTSISIQRIENDIMFRGIIMTFQAGRIYARAINGSLIDLNEPVPAIGFAGRELWGSSRGYIWSRTFPLMPSRTIIGPGPDTYTHVFPQHDVFGLLHAFGNPYQRVDKAHNIYLQTWVTTGGISAMALIFLFGHYLLTTFVSLIRTRKKEGTFIHGLRFGMLAGTSAFCVAAMATDSTIGSTGVFFVLLGLGYGLNFCVKRISQESEPQSAASRK